VAVFVGGATFVNPAFTRPFPIPRVTKFVAVDGGGIVFEGMERLGAFPEDTRKMIYPTERIMTSPTSKYGETIAAAALDAQFMFLYSL
jgi:hypothetical protein